jgi:putative membrane protein
MGNMIYFKRAWMPMALIASVLITMSACSENQNPANTNLSAEAQNKSRLDANSHKDAQFLVNATAMNLEEIQLGLLAQQKSNATDIKALGKMIEESHAASLKDLTTLAINKLITIPTSLTDSAKDAYKNLAGITGTEFDKQYCSMMIRKHTDAIALFELGSSESKDVDIKRWVASVLPHLRDHLNSAVACQNKYDKKPTQPTIRK